ncbi:MAG: hypothetical protein P8179_03090 [Candidatus Thiodiazotropha sp.]|jgi:hypothetical protein
MKIPFTIFSILTLTVFQLFAVELEVSPSHSNTGTFNLIWHGSKGETYRLVQLIDHNDKQLIYQGTDTARVMTGLPNGTYRYQVQGETGWSKPCSVTVAHHSLIRAFSFFSLGILVFLATLFIVVRGEKKN